METPKFSYLHGTALIQEGKIDLEAPVTVTGESIKLKLGEATEHPSSA